MKNLSCLVLVAVTIPGLAEHPTASKQYATLRQAYYVFDSSAYKRFSCHVDVGTMDAFMGSIRQATSAHPGALQVTDSLADYRLTMDHIAGLSITSPTMDITIMNEGAIANPARVKLGIQQTKDGFSKQVNGINQIISSVFDSFMDKAPDVASVTRKGSKWVIRSETNGAADIQTIDGNHIHEETSANGDNVVADSDYALMANSKLALQRTRIQVDQGVHSSVTELTVTYQKLGALQIPASVVDDSSVRSGAGVSSGNATVVITLQNCNISN